MVLRNETLDEDLISFVEEHPQGFRDGAAETIRAAGARHANASSRSPSYRDYYSDSDAALVAERDSLFIASFGYRF